MTFYETIKITIKSMNPKTNYWLSSVMDVVSLFRDHGSVHKAGTKACRVKTYSF